jgi:hypothetical protein
MGRTNFQKGDGSERQQDVLLAFPTGIPDSPVRVARIVLRQAYSSMALGMTERVLHQ